MPSFTPNLNLYLPGGGSESIGGSDEAADIDKLNKNFQKLDKFAWVRGGTEAERGLLPPEEKRPGLLFSETDTGRVWAWNGTGWVTALAADTGWVNITVNSGFAAISTAERPQARRIGQQVYLRGGFQSTGISSGSSVTPGRLPATYAPVVSAPLAIATSAGDRGGTARVVAGSGDIDLRVTTGSVSPYYLLGGSYLIG